MIPPIMIETPYNRFFDWEKFNKVFRKKIALHARIGYILKIIISHNKEKI